MPQLIKQVFDNIASNVPIRLANHLGIEHHLNKKE